MQDGTDKVYYDFLLFCKEPFTFPYVHDVNIDFPETDVITPMPKRRSPIIQYMGAESPITITLSGKIDVGATSAWRGGSGADPILKPLLDIWLNSHSEAWQWLSIGKKDESDRMINCKVRPGRLQIKRSNVDKSTRIWSLPLRLYSLSNLDETTWNNLQGIGI